MGYHSGNDEIPFVEEAGADDEIVEVDGVKIYIEGKELLYLTGVTMDYEDALFSTGFAFTNPNEAGRCGCGESFTVN